MRIPNTVGWGIALALMTALISGVSVFLNGRFVKLFDDPTLLAAVRNGLVGLLLVGLALGSGGLRGVRSLDRRSVAGLVVVGVIGGGISFALFFNGLAASTSPAAAIIHKTLFVWVAALAIPLLGERVGVLQVASLVLLLAGTIVLAPAGSIGAGVGEAMVVGATLLWTVEVIVAKRLLRGGVPVSLVAAARMAIGAAALFTVVGATGDLSGVLAFGASQWLFIAVTAALLTGYVLTWFGALQRAPATSVTSVLVLGAVVTTVLQSWSTGGIPAPAATTGNLLLLAGGLVAVAAAWLANRPLRLLPAGSEVALDR
jgi:drug/metabolite transporter (DMT)-like permease